MLSQHITSPTHTLLTLGERVEIRKFRMVRPFNDAYIRALK